MRELYWEEFQKKCCWDEAIDSRNNKNRNNGVADGVAKPTHNAGSASHLKIASDLKRKLGCDPPHSELFLYTHTKNHDGVSFINEKDGQIHLEAEGVEFEEDKLFYVVGGHVKKRRLYGLGSFAKAVPNRNVKTDVSYIP
ncbi:uncharacterized protein LOC111909381 [Lactuca sativa]|uniref:uncharacterized protein LOC111909381 n=1 Tax=Lactuca sativa TaxID=4236 RepID=UPI000CD8716D|nr:uncharacterized protein LOC111909381 [Lactuca sativa]